MRFLFRRKDKNKEDSSNEKVLSDLRGQNIHPITNIEAGDVFIASYPKSGVTWLRHLTADLMYGMSANHVPDIIVNLVFPDIHAYKYYLRTGRPAIFKTHHLPSPEMRKVVHLVRDGRDVMASYHAMLSQQGHNITLRDMICNNAGVFPCSWSQHCEAWMQNPYNAQILRISYEDMICYPKKTLESYCSFIGISCDDATISKAVASASFENLRSKEVKQGWGPKSAKSDGFFIRKGKIGSHKEEIPSNLMEVFVQKSEKQLRGLGYID